MRAWEDEGSAGAMSPKSPDHRDKYAVHNTIP
jgi:hypothetical protein